jgi:hypothetical protein
MRWQADLLAYSHKKVNQPGPLTRLYSGWRIPPPFDGQTFHTIPYCPHPISGDHYPPYNRIMALLKWLRQSPPTGETILLLDPDCIFVTAYHSCSTVGSPVAQSIGYMCPTTARGAELLKRHGYKPESLQPIGIPILIHRDDLRVLLPRWQEHTEAIRNDPVSRDLASWTAEMWGYVFASAELGLRHELRELAHSQMDDRTDLPFIHYCYSSSNAQGQWEWTKRTYKPWASVTEPPNDTSQATVTLISLLNEFAKIHKNMLFNQ